MNNPNPFVPKGSLLEQQSRRRSRLVIAVSCVLVVCVTGLVAILIQGCKRDQPPVDNSLTMTDTNPVVADTNPPVADTNPSAMLPPMTNPPVPPQPPIGIETPAATTYAVVEHDTLGKIAKAHGVTLKALEAANPGVDSKHLKIKQVINIPAPSASTSTAPGATTVTADAGGEVYVVKNNDTLTKIAHAHGITVKALKAANNLTTDHIKVNQKLKIPAKAETAAPAPAPDATSAPALPPVSAPALSVPAAAPTK